MEPIVNLEETPGKVVGKIKRRTPGEAQDWMVRQLDAMGIKLPYPKGLYRFKTHEEANEWERKHQIAAAVKRLRDHQPRPQGIQVEPPPAEDPLSRCWRSFKAWWKGSTPT